MLKVKMYFMFLKHTKAFVNFCGVPFSAIIIFSVLLFLWNQCSLRFGKKENVTEIKQNKTLMSKFTDTDLCALIGCSYDNVEKIFCFNKPRQLSYQSIVAYLFKDTIGYLTGKIALPECIHKADISFDLEIRGIKIYGAKFFINDKNNSEIAINPINYYVTLDKNRLCKSKGGVLLREYDDEDGNDEFFVVNYAKTFDIEYRVELPERNGNVTSGLDINSLFSNYANRDRDSVVITMYLHKLYL